MEEEERCRGKRKAAANQSVTFFVSRESSQTPEGQALHPDSELIEDDRLIEAALKSAGFSLDIRLWEEEEEQEHSFFDERKVGLVRGVWDWVDNYREFSAFVSKGAGANLPLSGDWHGLQMCSHKRYLVEFAEAHGVKTVPTVFKAAAKTSNFGSVRMLARSKGWGEVVLKPAVISEISSKISTVK